MILETPTPDILKSKEFYKKLKFSSINENTFTDGHAVVTINEDRFTRAGIILSKPDWSKEIESLSQNNIVFEKEGNIILIDSSGAWIKLTTKENNYDIQNKEKSILGNFAGVSLECPDINKSFNNFKALGFEPSMGGIEQGWVAMANAEGATISLMKPLSCPHLFFSPSFTYFNGKDNMTVIESVRKADVDITEEITHFNPEGIVDNIIIRDPGGFGFFIFSD